MEFFFMLKWIKGRNKKEEDINVKKFTDFIGNLAGLK